MSWAHVARRSFGGLTPPFFWCRPKLGLTLGLQRKAKDGFFRGSSAKVPLCKDHILFSSAAQGDCLA